MATKGDSEIKGQNLHIKDTFDGVYAQRVMNGGHQSDDAAPPQKMRLGKKKNSLQAALVTSMQLHLCVTQEIAIGPRIPGVIRL